MTNYGDDIAPDSMLVRYLDGLCTDIERAQIEGDPELMHRAIELARADDTLRQIFRTYAPLPDQPSPEEVVAFVAGTLDETRQSRLAQRAMHDPLLQAEIDLLRDLGPNPLLIPSIPLHAPAPHPQVIPPVERELQQSQRRHQQRHLWEWPLSWQRTVPLMLAGVIALLVVWVVVQQVQIHQQQAAMARNSEIVKAAFGDPNSQERLLVPSDAAPNAWGRVLISPSAPAVILYVKNLPPLPAGHEYQIWLVQKGHYVSLGTFTVDQQGRAWELIQLEAPLAAPQQITITVAPAGGSAQPTGPEYLGNRF